MISTQLAAQILFERPASGANIARYKTIEECVSAIGRVKDSVRRMQSTLSDTMPMDRDEAFGTFVTPIVQTSARCLEQFDLRTIPIDVWDFLLDGLLHANREAAADSLIARRLALIAVTDSAATKIRGAVLDSVIRIYLNARPIRFPLIERRLRERLTITPSSALGALESFNSVFYRAWDAGQYELATWTATEVERISPRAGDECGGDMLCMSNCRRWHQIALDYLARTAILDSLRRNTAAYTAIRQANWTKANEKLQGPPLPIGKRAPVIHGDFWYDLQQQTDTVPVPLATPPQRPKPGSVSLIVFLSNQCRTDGPARADARASSCLMAYGMLRRMAARFPELSMTIVTKTAGFYWYLEPLAPAAEAGMLARWWPGYHRIPAVVAVTNTAFWRVADPDRRRQNEETANANAYTLDETLEIKNQTMLLLDRDGIVVEAGQFLEKGEEAGLHALIEVLMKR